MRTLYGIAALAFTGFIFYNSSLPAPVSDETSYYFVNLVAWINAFLDKPVPLPEMNHYIRKTAHFTEYFLLAVSVAFPLYVYGVRGLWLMFSAGIFCVGYACLDEYHQSFVAGRVSDPHDILIDSIGILIGVILIRIICYIGRKTIFSWLVLDK